MSRKPWLVGSTRARSSCLQCEEFQLGRTAKKNLTEDMMSGAFEFRNKKWTRNLEKSRVLRNLDSIEMRNPRRFQIWEKEMVEGKSERSLGCDLYLFFRQNATSTWAMV